MERKEVLRQLQLENEYYGEPTMTDTPTKKKIFNFSQEEKELHEDFFDRINKFFDDEALQEGDFDIVHTSVKHPDEYVGWCVVFVLEYFEETVGNNGKT